VVARRSPVPAHTDTLVPEQHEQLQARGIQIADGAVARLVVGNDQLEGVELRDGTVVARTAVFVRPRFVPNADLVDEDVKRALAHHRADRVPLEHANEEVAEEGERT
jgi:hypothetical protein